MFNSIVSNRVKSLLQAVFLVFFVTVVSWSEAELQEKPDSEVEPQEEPEPFFQLEPHFFIQADGHFGSRKINNGADQYSIRRLRPSLDAKLGKDLSFHVSYEMISGQKGTLLDAYTEIELNELNRFRIGLFRAPFGLEINQSALRVPFFERSLASNFMPFRDTGVTWYHDFPDIDGELSVGWFSGVADRGGDRRTVGPDGFISGRFFMHPRHKNEKSWLHGLGIGIASTYSRQKSDAYSMGLISPGRAPFFNFYEDVRTEGDHYRVSPQLYYYRGRFGFLAEYVFNSFPVSRGTARERVFQRGANGTFSYVITGEDASFDGVTPKHDFDPAKGYWGALEFNARIASNKVDDKAFPVFANPATQANFATSYGVGVQWHLSRDFKAIFNYDHTKFNHDVHQVLPDEELLGLRLQWNF